MPSAVSAPTTIAKEPLVSLPSALFRARLALLAIATTTALPTPLSPFLGATGDGPMGLTLAIAGLWGLFVVWSGRGPVGFRSTTMAGLHLSIDVAALTLLLGLSGAAQNPFTILYFVPIALATLISQGWTWAVAGAAVLGFLALLGLTARAAGPHAQHGHFFHHVVGMAVALAVAGVLITHFVHRIARTLSLQQTEIARLSREREQDRFATSLGALAAGAAHELGTPLGTVQLLVGEWGLMTEAERETAQRTILLEVRRMKGILHRMTSSQLSADVLTEATTWTVARLASDLEQDLEGIVVQIQGDALTTQPRSVLVQILRELVRNALRASDDDRARVQLLLSASPTELVCAVSDQGSGMDEAAAENALFPFVSTTGGRGLGLFLAQVHVRQLGGHLNLWSRPAQGTRVALHLPLDPPPLG